MLSLVVVVLLIILIFVIFTKNNHNENFSYSPVYVPITQANGYYEYIWPYEFVKQNKVSNYYANFDDTKYNKVDTYYNSIPVNINKYDTRWESYRSEEV